MKIYSKEEPGTEHPLQPLFNNPEFWMSILAKYLLVAGEAGKEDALAVNVDALAYEMTREDRPGLLLEFGLTKSGDMTLVIRARKRDALMQEAVESGFKVPS